MWCLNVGFLHWDTSCRKLQSRAESLKGKEKPHEEAKYSKVHINLEMAELVSMQGLGNMVNREESLPTSAKLSGTAFCIF